MNFKKLLVFTMLLLVFTSGFSQNWLTDFETAKQVAKEENKKIILVFSGSDWCAPCIKLENEIWKSEDFKSFSSENYVLLRADFPRRKKNVLSQQMQEHNNQLAAKYNKNGYFPLVVVLDKQGKILGETGYIKTTPKNYINTIESF